MRTMTLDEAIGSIPAEWTAWELRSRGGRKRYVCVISRMDGDREVGAEGRGTTPVEAVLVALNNARTLA